MKKFISFIFTGLLLILFLTDTSIGKAKKKKIRGSKKTLIHSVHPDNIYYFPDLCTRRLQAFINKLNLINKEILSVANKNIENPKDLELPNKEINECLVSTFEKLCPCIKFIPADSGNKKKQHIETKKINTNNAIYKGIIISNNRVFYIRIDNFTKQAYLQLKEDLNAVSRLTRPPVGIIIDLRNASYCSENYQYLNKIIKIISLEKNKISQHTRKSKSNDTKNYISSVLSWPKIILIGNKTRGDAEIFIQSIKIKAIRIITVGEETAGAPFRHRKITLNTGDTLLFPVIYAKFSHVTLSSVKPDISEPVYPQTDYSYIANNVSGEKKDKAIEYACELLICLNKIVKAEKNEKLPSLTPNTITSRTDLLGTKKK